MNYDDDGGCDDGSSCSSSTCSSRFLNFISILV